MKYLFQVQVQLSSRSTKLEYMCILAVVFVTAAMKNTGSYIKTSFKWDWRL